MLALHEGWRILVQGAATKHTCMTMKIPQYLFEALDWGPETARNLEPPKQATGGQIRVTGAS